MENFIRLIQLAVALANRVIGRRFFYPTHVNDPETNVVCVCVCVFILKIFIYLFFLIYVESEPREEMKERQWIIIE